jgi:hypothetical protein
VGSLPWIVVHGETVWRLVFAVAATAFGLGCWALPRVSAWRSARRARGALGPVTGAGMLEADATVTLAGTLLAGGEPCLRVEDGAAAAAATVAFPDGALSERAASLSLLTGKVKVEIAGDVWVRTGSEEARPGLPPCALDAAAQARLELLALGPDAGSTSRPFRSSNPFRTASFRSLRHGDRVLARGTIRRVASDEGSLAYREASAAWVLVPIDGSRGVELASQDTPRVRGPAHRVIARGTAVLVTLLAIVSGVVGEVGLRVVGRATTADPAGVGVAAAVAFATPFQRHRALRLLGMRLHAEGIAHFSREQLERELATHELRRDCRAAAEVLLGRGHLAWAADRARSCGEHRLAAAGNYLSGRFEAASDAWAREKRAVESAGEAVDDAAFGVRVHLLAGRRMLARAELDRAIALTRPRAPKTPPDTRHRLLGMIADVLDAEPGAPDLDVSRLISVLSVDSIENDGRWQLLHLLEIERELQGGNPCPPRQFMRLLAHPTRHFGHLPTRSPALVKSLLDRLPKGCDLRLDLAAAMAAFESASGEHRAARAWTELVAREDGAASDAPCGDGQFEEIEGSMISSRARALRAAIEIAAGELSLARKFLTPVPETLGDEGRGLLWLADLREGMAPRREIRVAAERDEPNFPFPFDRDGEAWRIAASGDGAGLSAWLQRNDGAVGSAFLSLSAARITHGRDALVAWLRYGTRKPCRDCGPQQVLFDAAARRAAAVGLGSEILAAEIAPTVDAFHTKLLQQDIALPLAILDAL